MNRITLQKLAFVGAEKAPAIIPFSPGLNVITGPSDTGKSLIFECIAYVLGSSNKPKHPDEALGYSNLFLTFSTDAGIYTFERNINSSDVRVFKGAFEDISKLQSETYSGSANAKNNISEFLLGLIGINEKKLKKNERNEVVTLTFNILKDVFLVDELRIQSKISPLLSDNTLSLTWEKSLFRFLLTGEDYSNMIVAIKPEIRKADANARIDILTKLIEETSKDVDQSIISESPSDQIEKLNSSIQVELDKVSENQQQIDNLKARRKIVWENKILIETKIDQRTELLTRFLLLAQHYNSDLARLDAIIETGELITLIDGVSCPLCGSEAKNHRRDCVISDSEIESVKRGCEVEKNKILSLRDDLGETIKTVQLELEELETEKKGNDNENIQIELSLRTVLEPSINASNKALSELFQKKTALEVAINVKGSIQSMKRMKESIEKELKVKKTKGEKIPVGLKASEASQFLEIVEKNLKSWSYPNLGKIGFSEERQDIVIGNKNRGDQGKGFRAITHTAIILSIMEYCIKNNTVHPGFVVLDSPLVTFKGADKAISAEESIPDATKDNFYRDLVTTIGQVVILENDEPPADLISKMNYLHFTKNAGSGRVGFIPNESK